MAHVPQKGEDMSSYSEGQAHQLMDALERAGYSADEVTRLGQFGNGLNDFRFVLNGKAKIVQIVEEVKEKTKRILSPFLTIRTTPTTKQQLIADIHANKNEQGVADEVSDYAKNMMNDKKFVISAAAEDILFVALTLGVDLGFTQNPQTTDFMTDKFCQKWSAENLDSQVIELCKPDDGPRIREAWLDQPKGTAVWCAMDRLADLDGDPRVWRVGRVDGGGRWLCGHWVGPASRWDLDGRIVFRLRKIGA